MNHQVRFIDLFAGAGGLSLGFEMAGGTPVCAIEQDKWAVETYRSNNPGVQVVESDIEDISDHDVAALSNLRADLIIGGPPCQGFSHSNVVNKDPADPRNSLFRQFIRFVRIVRPRFAVMENVPGLIKTKTASGHLVIDLIKASFSEIGFSCQPVVLEAASFGVPQYRTRLFIVANDLRRSATFIPPFPTHSNEAGDLFSLIPEVTLWDAIGDLPQVLAETYRTELTYSCDPQNAFQRIMRAAAPRVIHNHEPMRHTARIVERFQQISFGSSEADVAEIHKPRRRGSPLELSKSAYAQNSRRQRPDAPCSTVVASSHTNFIHPFLHRNFTVRELMRIQSFPDDFIVRGKRAVLSKKLSLRKGLLDDIYLDQRSQVGNAVPPLLGKALANAIYKALREAESEAA